MSFKSSEAPTRWKRLAAGSRPIFRALPPTPKHACTCSCCRIDVIGSRFGAAISCRHSRWVCVCARAVAPAPSSAPCPPNGCSRNQPRSPSRASTPSSGRALARRRRPPPPQRQRRHNPRRRPTRRMNLFLGSSLSRTRTARQTTTRALRPRTLTSGGFSLRVAALRRRRRNPPRQGLPRRALRRRRNDYWRRRRRQEPSTFERRLELGGLWR